MPSSVKNGDVSFGIFASCDSSLRHFDETTPKGDFKEK
jgi:hypothetical protein